MEEQLQAVETKQQFVRTAQRTVNALLQQCKKLKEQFSQGQLLC